MSKGRYQRPNTSLLIHFDPVTWDALKAHAPGTMERAAYEFIQGGLGIVPKVVTNTTAAQPPPENVSFALFPPLR